MPMVVYTEDEVIEQCSKAEADGAARSAIALTVAKGRAGFFKKLLADIDTTICAHGKVDGGTPLHQRIQQALETPHPDDC